MLIKTKIYAIILESQGFKKEALEIYEFLLEKNKNDKEIIETIRRLKARKKINGVNIVKLKEFNELDNDNRYEFEKWLSKI